MMCQKKLTFTGLLLLCIYHPILSFKHISEAYHLRQTSFPYISGDSFRSLAHHIYDDVTTMNPASVRYKDIVFVKTNLLGDFFYTVHPFITNKYILITHNADEAAPGEFESYLNDERILFWFGQSPSIMNHKKFIAIPIGIANRYWDHGSIERFTQIICALPIDQQREYLLGINFRSETNPTARNQVARLFATKPYCTNIFNEDHEHYLRNMTRTKFVISPAGNSLDCHRIWEALYMGAIAIVLSSELDELLSDLPVLIVKNWQEVNEEFLIKTYNNFLKKSGSFNYAKLYLPYWIKLIEFYRNSVQEN